MEQQSEHTGDAAKPAAMKRTARMLHESSFATSAFTSSRSQNRPPGFIASSLDYKSSPTDATVAPDVTTKPGRNKKNSSQKQEEQLERERQYQQQRQFRSGHPTRAQGNFGPPPHSVRSLEDLENMTEEQIYKLFMDDPELHQAFIKATTKEQKGNTVPISAPVGAQNDRSSSRRKTSGSSKSKRSSANSKSLKQDDANREVPYFQWLFLFFLAAALLYKNRKLIWVPTSSNESTGSKNRVGKKQKKKQGGAGKKSTTKKAIKEEKPKTNPQPEEKIAVEKKSMPRKKKKKKTPSKLKTTIPSSSISEEENGDMVSTGKDQQPEPDLESTDASSGNTEPERAKVDPIVQAESDVTTALAASVDDDEWQTVTKSSKVERKRKPSAEKEPVAEEKKLEPPIIEKKTIKLPTVDDSGESETVAKPNKESNEQTGKVSNSASNNAEKPAASKDEKIKTDTEQPNSAKKDEPAAILKEKKPSSEVKIIEIPDVATKGEPAISIEDDAALALQLHEEEVNLARAVVANPQEEEWEEVTAKKKKGNKAWYVTIATTCTIAKK